MFDFPAIGKTNLNDEATAQRFSDGVAFSKAHTRVQTLCFLSKNKCFTLVLGLWHSNQVVTLSFRKF